MTKYKKKIKADVIILGCSLPGIVTALKLKTRFGDTMDIVVLDLVGAPKLQSACNVTFEEAIVDDEDNPIQMNILDYDLTAKQLIDNVARYYIAKFAKDFQIPLPDVIIAPENVKSHLNKVFQHRDGKTVECATDYHDFQYLGFVEKFELSQYHTLLDQCMRVLFQTHQNMTEDDKAVMLYYDQTTMETHICGALFFNTSREIMRTTVRLVCGASASSVSVLFYLHQCYRTSSSRNHLDGNNTRFREKLLGYCRKRIAHKLQKSVADITQAVKNIKKIRTYSDEQVVVETMRGEATYVCNLLAMALKPDELLEIQVEEELLSKENVKITCGMTPGRAKKFVVQYEENFWGRQGYSGDIFSIRGPIIWAMERPKFSTTGSTDRYAALVGYLMAEDSTENESREAVLEQLVKLFGEEAATPATYQESNVADVFVPHCGDYIALRQFTDQRSIKFLEWAPLDIFAEGDLAASLEAGHTAYLHLLSCLRPQAQNFDDVSSAEWPTFLLESPLPRWISQINCMNAIKWSIILSASLITMRIFKMLVRNK